MPDTETREIDWTEICELSYNTALEVLGERPIQQVRPWLEGREDDKAELENAVTQALTERQELKARADDNDEYRRSLDEATKKVKLASRVRRRTLRNWETKWWEDMENQVTEAAFRNDQAEL